MNTHETPRARAIAAVMGYLADLQGQHELEKSAIALGATGDPKTAVAEMVVELLPHRDWTFEAIAENPRKALDTTVSVNRWRAYQDHLTYNLDWMKW